jgi:hypothetical protein
VQIKHNRLDINQLQIDSFFAPLDVGNLYDSAKLPKRSSALNHKNLNPSLLQNVWVSSHPSVGNPYDFGRFAQVGVHTGGVSIRTISEFIENRNTEAYHKKLNISTLRIV